MPDHESFYVIRRVSPDGASIVTVLHEIPVDAESLGEFDNPGTAIDFAQEQVRRLNAEGVAAEYVDPPEDLVGAG